MPGATVERAETDAEGAVYEVHMTKSDGSDVTVKLDSNFAGHVDAEQHGLIDPQSAQPTWSAVNRTSSGGWGRLCRVRATNLSLHEHGDPGTGSRRPFSASPQPFDRLRRVVGE